MCRKIYNYRLPDIALRHRQRSSVENFDEAAYIRRKDNGADLEYMKDCYLSGVVLEYAEEGHRSQKGNE